MANDSAQFLERLHAARLLTPEQFEELSRSVTPGGLSASPDSHEEKATREYLIRKAWLSPYQIDEIVAGRGEALSFGGFRIVQKLDTSAAATTYLAIHPALNTPVVLKQLNAAWLEPEDSLGDYISRVQQACLVTHRHVACVLDAGVAHDTPFIVEEWVDGTDLNYLLKAMGPLPQPLALDYLRQAASALAEAHDQGIVHGQLDLSHLMLAPVIRATRADGSPRTVRPAPGATIKVSQMGQAVARAPLSKMTFGDAAKAGNLDAMPPERFDDAALTPAGDVYRLGCAFHRMLTGKGIWNTESHVELLLHLQNDDPSAMERFRADLSSEVVDLARRMLARDPADRVTLDELMGLLKAEAESSAVPVLTASETMSQPAQRQSQMAAFGGVVSVLTAEGVDSGTNGRAASDSAPIARAAQVGDGSSILSRPEAPLAEALSDVSLQQLLGMGVDAMPDESTDDVAAAPHVVPPRPYFEPIVEPLAEPITEPLPDYEPMPEYQPHAGGEDVFSGHVGDSAHEAPRPKKPVEDLGKHYIMVILGVALHVTGITLFVLWVAGAFNSTPKPPAEEDPSRNVPKVRPLPKPRPTTKPEVRPERKQEPADDGFELPNFPDDMPAPKKKSPPKKDDKKKGKPVADFDDFPPSP